MRHKSQQKPCKCPVCSSKRIAEIQYGLPIPSPELDADIDAGRVVQGGCCITGDDPAWRCMDCKTDIYEKSE